MKRTGKTLCFLLSLVAITAQAEGCRVLLPEGAVRYEGECSGGLANGHGKAIVPSRSDPNGYYKGQFNDGLLHGEATYVFARGNLTSTDYFLDGKSVNREAFTAAAAAAAAAAQPAWVVASQANTVAAYAQFI